MQVENPMVREKSVELPLATQELIQQYHKPVINMDRFRELWKDTTRRMEAGK